MKKKILLMFLVLALALAAVGGTAISVFAEQQTAEQSEQAEPRTEQVAPQNEQTAPGADKRPAEKPEKAHDLRTMPAPREQDALKKHVSVTGCGKTTADADTAYLTFRLDATADGFSEGKAHMEEMCAAVADAVKGIANASVCGETHIAHRPVSDGMKGGYAFTANLCIKLSEPSKAAEAKSAGESAGGTLLHTCYTLENESEALRQALTLAMGDAKAKAASLLGEGAELAGIKEEYCWHGPADEEGKVTVCANIRARFSL